MSDISLITQLAIILAVLSAILIIALLNLVMKRRSMVLTLITDAASAQKQSNVELSLTKLIPEWLAYKVKDTQYQSYLGGIAAWLEYARGNLLLATVGSIVALVGALLAASHLLLFGIVGASMMVVGLQILYAAAQDAGVFSSIARPTDDYNKASNRTSKESSDEESTEARRD